MGSPKKRLVFFGNEQLATGLNIKPYLLPALISAGYEVAALVLHQAKSISSRSFTEPDIVAVAKKHKITVLTPIRLIDISAHLASLGAEAGVLAAYGRIVPDEIIELFPKGIINLHPSLLPKLRGPTPIETAILNGDDQAGVSLMTLVSDLDAGPIYAQAQIKLSGEETKLELAEKLAETGTKLMVDNLPAILSGKTPGEAQDKAKATYTSLIQKSDGQLDFTKSAEQLERETRAYAGWPQSRTQIFGREVIITKAHAVPSSSEPAGTVETLDDLGILMLHSSDGYLCVDCLKPAGKAEMSAAEFIRGYKK